MLIQAEADAGEAQPIPQPRPQGKSQLEPSLQFQSVNFLFLKADVDRSDFGGLRNLPSLTRGSKPPARFLEGGEKDKPGTANQGQEATKKTSKL